MQEKPSHAFRCFLADGPTHQQVVDHFKKRANKVMADWKQLAHEVGYQQAREWLLEDAEKGLPSQFVASALEWLDIQESRQ